MAIYEIFSHPELRRYKTSIISKATLLMFLILIITFIPPLIIVYRSYGFWLREATYREQPNVAFKKEFILQVDLQSGSPAVYSTFQQYNQLMQSYLRIPLVKAREDDTNGDGKYDVLNLDLEVPMNVDDEVVGVKLLLFFYYKLRKFSQFHMESLAYIEYVSPIPGASLHIFGDLRLRQKQLLGHKGTDIRFNSSLVNPASPYTDSYSLATIFKNYTSRNVTTVLQDANKIWTSGRGSTNPFKISAVINYPEEVISYTPGFWNLIKWGWVQYVSVLLIFLYIFNKVKVFIFQHQLVPTIVESSLTMQNGRKDKVM
ncbi:transmembrane protein 231 [Biomphalaria glabrata]|uniref:Transmembrane protein 231 n=1 Tax=Biomphalaria glabrata TaxID=6526 RepID=A0A9U8EKP6_BIOGL|nr:transmembrane protein 231-like [Biomphalaria glabrata]KAI8762542.1 transmembrane protein 231-like [Biomphalaria glabrata]